MRLADALFSNSPGPSRRVVTTDYVRFRRIGYFSDRSKIREHYTRSLRWRRSGPNHRLTTPGPAPIRIVDAGSTVCHDRSKHVLLR